MSVHVVYELKVCHECAYTIAYGVESAEQEKAFDAAYGVWGDDLSRLVLSDSDGETFAFRCDYCREDALGERHNAVIFNK